MKRTPKKLSLMLAGLSVGTAFQLGGCNGILGFLANTNPCGTVLACDPLAFRFITSGADVPGVDVDVNPFCTFPPFCDPMVDPLTPLPPEGG